MILTLGSCRVLITMNHSQFHCLNTWQELRKRNLNPKCIIGRSWSPNEIYEMLQLILGFKDVSDYCGHEYTYEGIRSNIEFIREKFVTKKIHTVIMEVSSLKYYLTKDHKLVHNVIHEKINPEWTEKILSEKEVDFYVRKIVGLLPDVKIIFVNHFLHTRIPNRLLINKCLQKVKRLYPNQVLVLTPSANWSIETEHHWLQDPGHYHHLVQIRLAKWFDERIKWHLSS